MIKQIRRLEDVKGMRADEFAEVRLIYNLDGGKVTLLNQGIVYNIGLDRFSLIEPMVTESRSLGRVNYDWNASNKTWECSIDDNQPFEEDSPEYKRYQSLLNQAGEECLSVR